MFLLLQSLFFGCVQDKPEVRACNGSAALCDRPFDQVALPATHNAMSNADDGWVAPNQEHGIQQQLDDGIRGMLLDTYEEDGTLLLCHSYCDLGSTPLVEALGWISDFLDANPDEVLSLQFQDAITAEQTADAFEASGLIEHVYTHTDGEDWPTLAQMADADTRVLVSAEVAGPPPDWYAHAWDLYFDTPYDFERVEEFSCDLNRGSADNPLFLLNHWLGPVPTRALAEESNSYEVLYARANQCQEEAGHIPNLVAVNFYDIGALFEVTDALNGVEAPGD